MSKMQKDSLLKGTLMLALATLFVRFVGLFQRVPLDYILNDEGSVAFNAANNIYLLLLGVATAGIPSVVSKMVSQRYAIGRQDEAQRIYRAALLFGCVSGVILSLMLVIFAPAYANWSKAPNADLAIRAIAPALLMFPIIAMMRGYFQGRQMVTVGGKSQIVEQILRVGLGLGLALILFYLGYDNRTLAAAVTFGTAFGAVGAFAMMLHYGRKLKRQDREEMPQSRSHSTSRQTSRSTKSRRLELRKIYGEIFSLSLPVVITAITVQALYTFDTTMFLRLSEGFYETAQLAENVLRNYGNRAQPLAGIPPILAIALCSSLIPVISSAYATKNLKEVERQAGVVMRIVCFTGVPVALLIAISAESVTGFLFPDAGGSLAVALLVASTGIQIAMMTSNSILLGLGLTKKAMGHTILGMISKVVVSAGLAPIMGIYAFIVGSAVCFTVVALLNIRSIRQIVPLKVLGSNWAAYLLAVLISGSAGFGVHELLTDLPVWLPFVPIKILYLLSGGITCMVAGILYLVLVIKLGVVKAEELKVFPAPMRKLLQPLFRLLGRTGN